MKASRQMARLITEIADSIGLDLTKPGASAKVVNDPYMDLHIECIARNQVSVAHYYRQNGDSVADPDMVFYTDTLMDGGWIPVYFQQGSLNIFRQATNLEEGHIVSFHPREQADQASFANKWAKTLRDQGFPKAALDAHIQEQAEQAAADPETRQEYVLGLLKRAKTDPVLADQVRAVVRNEIGKANARRAPKPEALPPTSTRTQANALGDAVKRGEITIQVAVQDLLTKPKVSTRGEPTMSKAPKKAKAPKRGGDVSPTPEPEPEEAPHEVAITGNRGTDRRPLRYAHGKAPRRAWKPGHEAPHQSLAEQVQLAWQAGATGPQIRENLGDTQEIRDLINQALRPGCMVRCQTCGKRHQVREGTDLDADDLYYTCGGWKVWVVIGGHNIYHEPGTSFPRTRLAEDLVSYQETKAEESRRDRELERQAANQEGLAQLAEANLRSTPIMDAFFGSDWRERETTRLMGEDAVTVERALEIAAQADRGPGNLIDRMQWLDQQRADREYRDAHRGETPPSPPQRPGTRCFVCEEPATVLYSRLAIPLCDEHQAEVLPAKGLDGE